MMGTNKNGQARRYSSASIATGAEFIFSYMKPYLWIFLMGVLFVILSGLCALSLPYNLMKIINQGSLLEKHAPLSVSKVLMLEMIGILILQCLFSYLKVLCFTYVGETTLSKMRTDLYARIVLTPMNFFSENRVGDLLSRINNDLNAIQNSVVSVLAELLRNLITASIGIVMLFYISSRLAIISLIIIPVMSLVIVMFNGYRRRMSIQRLNQMAESGTMAYEIFQGISNVKSFTNEDYEIKRYVKSIKKLTGYSLRLFRAEGLCGSIFSFNSSAVLVIVLWVGLSLISKGELTLDKLTGFAFYTAFVGGSLSGFSDGFARIKSALSATGSIRELLSAPVEEIGYEHKNNQDGLYKLSGSVRMENLSFSYPSRPEAPVLKDITIEARKGERIALIGMSGSGKTTITALLLRFYEPSEGRLLFDETPSFQIPLSTLRSQIAIVSQDILLFGGTIRENIAYGKLGATEQEIEGAARQAYAHEFIMSLPDGYNTIVGDRGMRLSGGQRQRIAIARALIKDPVILLLDEATSSLDPKSEAIVQTALNNLMANRTSFIITHRHTSIRNVDKIFLLEDGAIKQYYNHQELSSISNS